MLPMQILWFGRVSKILDPAKPAALLLNPGRDSAVTATFEELYHFSGVYGFRNAVWCDGLVALINLTVV